MRRFLRALYHELDLSIANEDELRGTVKGFVVAFVVYVSLLILVSLPVVWGTR